MMLPKNLFVTLNAVLAGMLFAGSVWALDPKLPRPLAEVSIDLPGAKRIRVTQPKSKARLIAILSSTCKHCIDLIGPLSRVERQYRAKGVTVFAALVDEDAAKELPSFIARTKPSFPIGTMTQDNTRRVADFGMKDRPFVPIVLFVDGDNVVRYQFDGEHGLFANNTENTLKNMVEVLLKQK
jgi:hypothetical protein